ncbi:hypothetical protein INR49_020294 [Caranx melampygus]|nr:hypothetical protein INR49_020294 [Caranx melampygus]
MAGASDPLEDMLFSEVDEKAVSDLVGSLESQLAGQSNPAGKTDENGGAGSVAPANHHLGKTLPAPVGTTTLEQQQQGRRNKPEMRQEINSKDVSPDKAVTSPALGCTPSFGEPSTTSAACVNATSSGSQSHGASITTLTASGVSTLASPPASISTTSSRGSKVAPGTGETSTEANPTRKRITTPRRTASARIKSLNGAAVTTRRNSNTAVAENASSVDPSETTPNSTRPVTSSINTSTFTLTNASLPVGQSAIALDRGTPTIALHRLPSHIVASIAQNGNGTSVSALVQQGSRVGPVTSSASQENHSKTATDTGAPKTDDCQSKIVMSSQSGSVNSVINTVSSAASVVTPTTTTAAATTTTTITQPLSSATATACVTGVATSSVCGTGQTTSVTTTVSMVRPTVPSPAPAVATSAQSQPRPGLTAPQRIVAPQLIVRPPQQQTTIQLPPGFTIPPVSCDLSDHQAVSFDPGQDGTISLSHSLQLCPPDLLFFLFFFLFLVLSCAPPKGPRGTGSGCDGSAADPRGYGAPGAGPGSLPASTASADWHRSGPWSPCRDAKIEPEEFTSRLQTELKSSPQPYLVPFLKKSLPALRLSLLNSQQSLTQPPQQGVKPAPGGVPPAIVAGPAVRIRHPNSVSTTTGASALPAGTLGHAAAMGIKTAGAVGSQVRMPVVITQSVRAQGTMGKGAIIQAGKSPVGLAVQVSGNQKNKLNDPGGGSFRDDDDINDVASMAGVNLNEESARILATNSELVGTQIRSCKDEAFLHPGLLHRRILETEKVSTIAQHRLDSCKDDECYEQSADVRSQLRFFEQLERIEKQRKDEQEREILLKAAKSRSRQEDPEQARLKQKAKEVSCCGDHYP